MPVFIGSNTIASVKTRLAVDSAIRKAIGEREGTWRVSVMEAAEPREWKIVVRGPRVPLDAEMPRERLQSRACGVCHPGEPCQDRRGDSACR